MINENRWTFNLVIGLPESNKLTRLKFWKEWLKDVDISIKIALTLGAKLVELYYRYIFNDKVLVNLKVEKLLV